jgi:hypothetical protein
MEQRAFTSAKSMNDMAVSFRGTTAIKSYHAHGTLLPPAPFKWDKEDGDGVEMA